MPGTGMPLLLREADDLAPRLPGASSTAVAELLVEQQVRQVAACARTPA